MFLLYFHAFILISRFFACEEERVEIVKVLLKHGANPYSKNKVNKIIDFPTFYFLLIINIFT
jgi:hypothetical protein